MPPLMSNHGCYTGSLGALTKWLAEQAEALGVEIYPGFAVTDVMFGDGGEVEGVITGDMGVARDGSHKDSFTPGIVLAGKYTLFAEGARGSLSKMLIGKLGLDAESGPQKFGIGLKELWEVPPGSISPAWCSTPWAGRSTTRPAAARSSTISARTWCRSASSSISTTPTPILNPFEEFQRAKTHPSIARYLEGGKRIAYGARALTEGGSSRPASRLSRAAR